jgi:hypothetical protein
MSCGGEIQLCGVLHATLALNTQGFRRKKNIFSSLPVGFNDSTIKDYSRWFNKAHTTEKLFSDAYGQLAGVMFLQLTVIVIIILPFNSLRLIFYLCLVIFTLAFIVQSCDCQSLVNYHNIVKCSSKETRLSHTMSTENTTPTDLQKSSTWINYLRKPQQS